MSHWDRTYQLTEISAGDSEPSAHVWSAITDDGRQSGNLCIRISKPGFNAEASMFLRAYQMRDLALVLNSHADRLDELKRQVDFLLAEEE